MEPYKTVSARATEDTKVIKLPFSAFKIAFEKYPDAYLRVVQIVMIRQVSSSAGSLLFRYCFLYQCTVTVEKRWRWVCSSSSISTVYYAVLWSGFILICILKLILPSVLYGKCRVEWKLKSKYRLLEDQTKQKFYFRSKKYFSLVFNCKHFKHFVRIDSYPIHLA